MARRCPTCGVESDSSPRHCPICGTPNIPACLVLRSEVTGKECRLRVSTPFGRALLSRRFDDEGAKFASELQYELLKDELVGAWVLRHCPAARNPTCYDGEEVTDSPREVRAGGAISIGRRHLRLVVRFEDERMPAEPTGPEVPPLADPFQSVTYAQALAGARSLAGADARALLEGAPRLLFDDQRTESPAVAIVRDPAAVPEHLWIIGDLHADLLALANAWHFIRRTAEASGARPHVVFLGDFIDRGRDDHATLLYLFGLVRQHPGQICVIAGNHDEDYQWSAERSEFVSTIEPAEYPARLNQLRSDPSPAAREQVELGVVATRFFRTCPRAVVLPDGLLLAHAGFPHHDLLGDLKEPKDLSRPQCLQDFTWLRISDTAERKRPNRENRGCQFGWGDFADFCSVAGALGVPVRRLVRGHDHVPARYQYYPDYREYPVLTLNTMGRPLEGELAILDHPPLACVARHVPGELPQVFRLPIEPREVQLAFPPYPGTI